MTSPGGAKRELLAERLPNESPFDRKEYADRVSRIRQAMEAAGIQCLYLTAPESIYYVSGYACEWYQGNSPRMWWPASGIAIHVDHDTPVHFEHYQEETLLQITAVSEDVRLTHAEGPRQQEFVVDELKAMGWLNGRTGLELGSHRPMPSASSAFSALIESVGGSVCDGTDVVRRVRRYKSPAEIQCIRQAQYIAEIGMAAAQCALAAGVTELDVYGAVIEAMSRAGGEPTAIPCPVVSGPRSATLHGLASRRRIEYGELVGVDVCGVYNRYHANLARSFSIGQPSQAVAEAATKVYGAVDVFASLARPHLPVRELLQRLESYYDDVGILGDEWWVGGYELGIAFPPDWVGGFIYSMGDDPGDEVLAPGEVVNFEANFYLPDRAGIAFCINTLAIEEAGASFLQTIPSELVTVANA